MNQFPNLPDNDDDDTLQFQRWEADVLKNHPNPRRIGCPSDKILRKFVETPGEVTLVELHDRHIANCAECVRELIELRRYREERLRRESVPPRWTGRLGLKSLTVGLSACFLIGFAVWRWRSHDVRPSPPIRDEAAVAVTLDLSQAGATRTPATGDTERPPSLPRRLISLRLRLPYHSPAGVYRITITNDKAATPLQVEEVIARADGPATEAQVRFDLRRMRPGRYYLGTSLGSEAQTNFYSIMLD